MGGPRGLSASLPKRQQRRRAAGDQATETSSPNAEWEKLKQQAAKDQRLRVIASDLSRYDLLALIGACDVFLSLHRSEGYGRGIAEAGLIGLEVVASTFGGNVDFCRGSSYHMIPCKPTPIKPGTYAGAANHWWGEPDQVAAHKQLIQATRSQSRSKLSQEALQNLSREQTGYRYRAGLKALALGSTKSH